MSEFFDQFMRGWLDEHLVEGVATTAKAEVMDRLNVIGAQIVTQAQDQGHEASAFYIRDISEREFPPVLVDIEIGGETIRVTVFDTNDIHVRLSERVAAMSKQAGLDVSDDSGEIKMISKFRSPEDATSFLGALYQIG